jgi:hypothetical protein
MSGRLESDAGVIPSCQAPRTGIGKTQSVPKQQDYQL